MQSDSISPFLYLCQPNHQCPHISGLLPVFPPAEEEPLISRLHPTCLFKDNCLEIIPLISCTINSPLTLKLFPLVYKQALTVPILKKKKKKTSLDPISTPLSQQNSLIEYIKKSHFFHLPFFQLSSLTSLTCLTKSKLFRTPIALGKKSLPRSTIF